MNFPTTAGSARFARLEFCGAPLAHSSGSDDEVVGDRNANAAPCVMPLRTITSVSAGTVLGDVPAATSVIKAEKAQRPIARAGATGGADNPSRFTQPGIDFGANFRVRY
ncbi:MAG: hypothetical protein AAF184_06615 [Pseudomonadota bacterium]